MKQKILYTLFLAGLLASCNSDEEIVKKNPGYLEPGYGALTVTLTDPSQSQTRAVGDKIPEIATKEEKLIQSVAFFVNTEAAGDKGGTFGKYFSNEIPLSVNGFEVPLAETGTPGTYTCKITHKSDGWNNPQVIVVANYAENGLTAKLNAVTDFADLQNVLIDAVAANPTTPLLMYSTKVIESWKPVAGSDGGGNVSETFLLDRLVSRIDIHNMAYNKADEAKGFVLKSAQLIRPRTGSYLMPNSPKTAPAVSATPFAALTNVTAFETDYQQIDTLYAYENANTTANEETAVQINGTFLGTPVSKIIEFRKPMKLGVAGDPIPLARNHRYVININPTPDSTDIKWDIVVKPWAEADTIKVKPANDKPEVTWSAATLTAAGATWTPATKTLDITGLTADNGTFVFTASGGNIPDVKFGAIKYDTDASSIGGAAALAGLITKEDAVIPYADEKITRKFTIKVPKQLNDEKVPLEFKLYVYNSANEAKADSIKITSRPNYANTTIKPVLVGGKYWAPVNVGATQVPSTITTWALNTCGYAYQWGRLTPFSYNVTPQKVTPTSLEQLPTYAEGCSNTGTNKDKFIIGLQSEGYTWFKEYKDPKFVGENVWPREAQPCPAGWRIPTKKEFEAILTGTPKVANGVLSIAGLILPAAGSFGGNTGIPAGIADDCMLFTSTCTSTFRPYKVNITASVGKVQEDFHSPAASIRCIQED